MLPTWSPSFRTASPARGCERRPSAEKWRWGWPRWMQDDEREMREGMGLGESGLDRMIRLSQDAAGLITFFTGNANEVRAWTVPEGATAVEAAGRVHTDFAKGFIRAEVMGAEALAAVGGPANARRQGALSQEGKSYTVRDGDVLNILFNV